MKGKVQYQTPWRQYEYLKVTIEFDNEEEKGRAIEMAISDCQRYKNFLPVRDAKTEEKGKQASVVKERTKWDIAHGIADTAEVDGMKGRKVNDKWEWYDTTGTKNKWVTAPIGLAQMFEEDC